MNTFCFILLPSDDREVRQERSTDYDEYSCPLSLAIQRQLEAELDEQITVAVNSPTHKVKDRSHGIEVYGEDGTIIREYKHNIASAMYVEYFDRTMMNEDDVIMHAVITGQPREITTKLPQIELSPIAFCLEEVDR